MTMQGSTRWTEIVYTLLRVAAAWVYLQHGAQKLFGVLGGFGGTPGGTAPIASLMGVAGIIEFFAGSLILIGLATRVAAFIASGEMAVAYFMQHAPHGFLWTVLNHGELPAILAFLFLYISLAGPGPYSVDAALSRSRRHEPLSATNVSA
jgi:putative oxidoreductase